MTLLHVRKTRVHVWRIPRAGGMNGVSVGTGCLRLSRAAGVNSPMLVTIVYDDVFGAVT
jgi:hypothetical protein